MGFSKKVFFIFSSFLAWTPLYAENPPNLNPEIVQKLSDYLHLNPDSPEMRKILSDYQNQKNFNPTLNEETQEKQFKVVKHLRGPKGIPLTSPVQNKELKPKFSAEDVTQEHLRAQREAGQKMLDNYTKVPNLPTCNVSKRNEVLTGYSDKKDGQKIMADMLFIRKGEVPLDPEVTFGESAQIYTFRTDKPNFDSYAAIGLGAKCLPYRIRITKEKVIREEGKNALKNYDKDPYGDGELHDLIKLTQSRISEEGAQ